ncbi:MAG: ABC transporter ATP-binding protein [Vicinamibacterales bacterium]
MLTILHPLSLDVPDGQCLAIIGPSGSGKSTLLGLIAGLDAPTSGQILIDGVDITRLDEDALGACGEKILPVLPVLPPGAVVDGAREHPGADGDRGPARRAGACAGAARRGGAARPRPPLPVAAVGEQQRVAIARALANDPPLILADEPTGNLDSSNGRHILDLLLKVRHSRRVTLVLVTHDLSVAAVADERLVLRDGRPVVEPHEVAGGR